MASSGIKVDLREFRSTLRQYRQYTRRDIPTMINTAGFYISRGACRLTHKTDKATMMAELQNLFHGENVKKFTVRTYTASGLEGEPAPLVALLINSERRKRGQKGLYGEDMRQAVNRFIGLRLKSIAFIKSGWLPAIRQLAPLADRPKGAPPLDPDAKQVGVDKGRATPARSDAWVARCIIENFANAKGDHTNALTRYAGAGLEYAVSREVDSMREYIKKKMQQTADRVNAGKR